MTISRVRTVWSGFQGAPGYTSLYFGPESTGLAAAVRAFWDAAKSALPSTVTVQVESSGDNINENTGEIVGSWSEAAVLSVTGTAVGAYAGPAGALIRWTTGGIVAGKRVKGRTFLVPAGSAAFDSAGTLDSADITTLNLAADGLIADTANQLVVWARPFPGSIAPPRPARLGSFHIVTGRVVPDKAVVLRSRRD